MVRALLLATSGIASLTLGPASTAAAQTAAEASRSTVFQAAFFAQFAPRTALDIAQRVPGFTLDLGNSQGANGQDIRGFAGTAGNVVINGARPSTKAESLDTTLARIPSQRVIRVELGPGDLYGSDYSGKSQVLNVVLSQEAGIDGNVTAAAKRWFTGYVNTDVQGSAVIRRGASTINFSAGTGRNRQLEGGPDVVTAATGAILVRRDKLNSYFNKDPFVAASWSLERGADRAVRLNARWQPSRFDLFQDNRVTPTGGAPHDDNLIQHFRRPVVELGGDITRPFAGGAIKFVGLATRRKRDDIDQYIQHVGLLPDNSGVNGGFEQTTVAQRNETIGRLTWTRPNLLGVSFETGAEAALNSLDDRVDLFAIDAAGQKIRIDLPITNARVEEKRGEFYVNLGRNLSSELRIDGGVNYEFSSLKVRGDAVADRTLNFLKPNIAIDWKPGGGWHNRFSIRRTVAQLDFYDFISSGDLSAQRVTGSNADLVPQRAWEFRASVDHALLGDGLIKLDAGHDLISMVQDQVLIIDDNGVPFSGPGNLGTGRHYFVSLMLDAPLGSLWRGLRAKFNGALHHTSVIDPITHRARPFSGYYPNWEWQLSVRRDAGNWSYGFDLNDNRHFTFYRTDEFDRNMNRGAFMTAFVEYRPTARTAINLSIDNLLDTHGARQRLLFSPNRADPQVVNSEFRDRNRHRAFQITLKQSFGGSMSPKIAKNDNVGD